jgi:hypothetical protein
MASTVVLHFAFECEPEPPVGRTRVRVRMMRRCPRPGADGARRAGRGYHATSARREKHDETDALPRRAADLTRILS